MNRSFCRSLLSTFAWQINRGRGTDRRWVTGVEPMDQGGVLGKSLFKQASIVCVLAGLTAFATVALADGNGPKAEAKVGDAYARGSDDGLTWTIGTKSVQMTFDGREGVFRLVSFLNKSCEPPLEYVDAENGGSALCTGLGELGKKPTAQTGCRGRQSMDAKSGRRATGLPRAGGRPSNWI